MKDHPKWVQGFYRGSVWDLSLSLHESENTQWNPYSKAKKAIQSITIQAGIKQETLVYANDVEEYVRV